MKPSSVCGGTLKYSLVNDGREYVEWTEKATKTRNGEGEPRAFPPKGMGDRAS